MRLLLLTICALLHGTVAAREASGSQNVSLPFVLADLQGMRWDVHQDGSIGDGGNDLYDGGGRLYLDGRQLYRSNGQAVYDRERHEVVLSPMMYRGLRISRRVLVSRDRGYCRWAEVLENPTSERVSIVLRIGFDMGGSIQTTRPVNDAKTREPIGMAVGDQRHCVGVIAGGRGGKVVAGITPQQGGDQFYLQYSLEVAPRQTVVVVHVQGYRQGIEASAQFVQETRESEILSPLPKELLKGVVNFRPTGNKSIDGDYELLRGEGTDLIELRHGPGQADRAADLLRGALRDSTFQIRTAYGEFEFEAGDVACILNPRSALPRQLLVTKFGEVYTGRLREQVIAFELTDGRRVEIPLEAISRIGGRIREGEPEEWKLVQPMALLRAGDRVTIYLPYEALRVNTRYGLLSLRPEDVSTVTFRPDEGRTHEIQLVDGSTVSGLVEAESFDFRLAGGAVRESAHVPASSLNRIQFVPSPEGAEPWQPVLTASNGDVLVGALAGMVHLDMAYDTILIDCGEIERLTHISGTLADVEMTLWDGSVLRGNVREGEFVCRTLSGVELKVPVPLIAEYDQPRPAPGETMRSRIEALVKELDSPDWRKRMGAQAKLMQMGPIAIAPLRALHSAQSVETQGRIELMLPALEERGRRAGKVGG